MTDVSYMSSFTSRFDVNTPSCGQETKCMTSKEHDRQ